MPHTDLLPTHSTNSHRLQIDLPQDATITRPLRPIYRRSGKTSSDLLELQSIFNAEVSLSVLQRPVPVAIDRYLAGHSPQQACERAQRVLVDHPEFSAMLQDFPISGRACLEDELRFLIELFATLSDSPWVGARLCISHQPSCPRFHVDRVGLRLICTWRGPGTEWLDHADVDRRFLGFGSQGIPDVCSGLIKPGAQIRRLKTYDIGLFKGELWPGNAGRGAVHRSPTVSPLSPHRITVTLDELDS